MFHTAQAPIIPKSVCRAMLGENKAEAATLDGAIMHLFQNDITPDGDTVVADLTAADFTGYAASGELVWGVTHTNPNGHAQLVAPSVQFQLTGLAVTNTIYGYYITNAGGTVLLAAERFSVPVVLTEDETAIVVVPVIPGL